MTVGGAGFFHALGQIFLPGFDNFGVLCGRRFESRMIWAV
jgi:hypothetical protein